MSRNNNDLPMLPPWLSESDVTQTGYEAPVQNLPHQELIPEDNGPRRLFSRKSEDRAESDKKKRKSRRKDKAEETSAPAPAEHSAWGPPESAVPHDDRPAPAPEPARHHDVGGSGFPDNGAAASGPMAWQAGAPAEYRPAPPQPYSPPPVVEQPYHPAPPPNSGHPAPQPPPAQPPQSAARPPIPPAPQPPSAPVADNADAEMTVRVTRRTDLPPSPHQPTPPQQPAPTPPPLPDWSQAAASSAERSGPPPRLGVPDGYGTGSSGAAPADSPAAAPDSGQPRALPVESHGPADTSGASENAPDWLTRGESGPTPAPVESAAGPQQSTAAPVAASPMPDSDFGPASVGGAGFPTAEVPETAATPPPHGPAPVRPDATRPASAPPERPAPSVEAARPGPAPESVSRPPTAEFDPHAPHSGSLPRTAAPQGVSQPRVPQPRTGELPIAPEQTPMPHAGGRPADPRPAPAPYAAPPQPDAQWQGPAQPPRAPGADQQQWHAPQPRPDQYSQPQQYAQPNPYAQGQQYGPAEQYQQARYQNPQAQQYQQQHPPTGQTPSLADVPMRRAKKAPGSGWRRAVHHMSGGAINPGMSAEELRLQELVARIRQPVRGDYRIATLSLKGGVGKTTTTMGIGSIFASIRGDRVIAVDANPDFGTLSQRVPLQTRSTVRDLLLDQQITSYGDVRRHTSQATSRLEVLASERDPAASESFSEDEYRQVLRVLQRFYNIILTDCGTGLMHSAMAGVLDLAHSLVLISSSAIDGARSAAATLDWLSLHGHDHLVRNAVVVINLPREGSPNVAIQHLREYFLARCRAVHVIPYDPHLAEGAEIDLARLHKNTKRALVELAATVADDFATDHRRFGA
ncbi:MinD/ParA family ATP-binding protein [Nocardia spumae]|uniref:MinD/ParA family ATP-binding protein n=1 Tax=Nocardia spumae TaxID=2887190 RepID=UPI001D14511D|nr:MinD/ParA family protein [Nocardia spumae]